MNNETKRQARVTRKTAETEIDLCLVLEGKGKADLAVECGFMEHMLTLLAAHACFDVSLTCKGDTQVDYHHSVEDMGICLGQALQKALGEKRGITRYGSIILPMDEALILCALDMSGRSFLNFEGAFPSVRIGDFDTELVEEFFAAFTREARCTLHIKQLAGSNTHHIIEGIFKAFARVLKQACAMDATLSCDCIPSTKEVL